MVEKEVVAPQLKVKMNEGTLEDVSWCKCLDTSLSGSVRNGQSF